jgi:hypothetical protein
MSALNWKEGGHGWEAHAGRVVGGCYWIRRHESTDFFNRPTGPVWFEVAHSINEHPGYWRDRFLKPPAPTLDEARALAQADHDRLATIYTDAAQRIGRTMSPDDRAVLLKLSPEERERLLQLWHERFVDFTAAGALDELRRQEQAQIN